MENGPSSEETMYLGVIAKIRVRAGRTLCACMAGAPEVELLDGI